MPFPLPVPGIWKLFFDFDFFDSPLELMLLSDTVLYNERPKTGRPAFGIFENRPVPKRSGFQTLSDNRTLMSGYRTFGPFTLQRSAFGISAFFTKLDRFI